MYTAWILQLIRTCIFMCTCIYRMYIQAYIHTCIVTYTYICRAVIASNDRDRQTKGRRQGRGYAGASVHPSVVSIPVCVSLSMSVSVRRVRLCVHVPVHVCVCPSVSCVRLCVHVPVCVCPSICQLCLAVSAQNAPRMNVIAKWRQKSKLTTHAYIHTYIHNQAEMAQWEVKVKNSEEVRWR